MPTINEVSVPSRRYPVMKDGFFTLPVQTFLEDAAKRIIEIQERN